MVHQKYYSIDYQEIAFAPNVDIRLIALFKKSSEFELL